MAMKVMLRVAALGALTLLASNEAPAAADDPTLKEILEKAGAHCLEIWRDSRQFVAEEQDMQRFYDKSGKVRRTRSIHSDYYVINDASDANAVVEFRDVFTVDGKPVRRNPQLVLSLLNRTWQHPRQRSDHINAVVNQHNLIWGGRLNTNFAFGLAAYLHPLHQPHERFRLAPERASADGEVVVCFEETGEETLNRLGRWPNDRKVPSTGCAYLARPDYDITRVDAAVLLGKDLKMRYITEYVRGSGGLHLPVRRRVYAYHPRWVNGLVAEADATYSNFRRFTATSRIAFQPIE